MFKSMPVDGQVWIPWKPKCGDVVKYLGADLLNLVVDVHHPFGHDRLPWVVLMGPRGLIGPLSIKGFQKITMRVRDESID